MLDTVEFYKQDIDALKALGHKIIICTKYSEIPFNFDAMFVWWWTYALWPVLLSRILRKPSIITGTYNFCFPKNFNGKDYFRRPWWQKIAIKYGTKLTSLNLFVNQIELKSCSKHFKLSNARYYPHTIHSDYLKGPADQRRRVLFNLAWSEKTNLIRKGISELLQAVHLPRSLQHRAKQNCAYRNPVPLPHSKSTDLSYRGEAHLPNWNLKEVPS